MIAVISGGMDSAALLWGLVRGDIVNDTTDLMAQMGLVEAVSFYYGQRHRNEIRYAAGQCHELGVKHTIVDISDAGLHLSGSALTDPSIPVPHGHYEEESMKQTVVPNRNAIMMNIAAGIALARGHLAIATAVHAGDHAIYPDCRPKFVSALQKMIRIATDVPTFSVLAPFVNISKTDIVLNYGAQVDYSMTWSCYEGGEQHCGKCGTCVERIESFTDSNTEDPTEYKTA